MANATKSFVITEQILNGARREYLLQLQLQIFVHQITIFLVTMEDGATPRVHILTWLNLLGKKLAFTKEALYLFYTKGSLFELIILFSRFLAIAIKVVLLSPRMVLDNF